jgi:hypothetical protein
MKLKGRRTISLNGAGVTLLLLGFWTIIAFAANRASNREQLVACRQKLDEIALRLATDSAADQLSSGQEAELKRIECILADSKLLPATFREAGDLKTKVDGLVKSIGPSAQLEASPRLLPVRWGVEAVWTVRQTDEQRLQENPSDLEDSLSSLLEREPSDCPKHLHDLVVQKRKSANEAASQQSRRDAMQRANNASQRVMADQSVVAALEGLSGLQGEDVDSLRAELRAKLLQNSRKQRIDVMRDTLERSRKLDNDRLRQAGIARVQDAAISVLLDWETERPRPEEQLKTIRDLIKDCQNSLDEITRKQQDELAKKIRNYQKWALEQIKGFNVYEYDAILPRIETDLKSFGGSKEEVEWGLLAAFPCVRDVLQEKLGVSLADVQGSRLSPEKQKQIYNAAWSLTGWNKNINTELAYRATREAMIGYLLPINASLLDQPVAQLYQKAFAKGWEKLEGRNDQLEVANATVWVPKKPLE